MLRVELFCLQLTWFFSFPFSLPPFPSFLHLILLVQYLLPVHFTKAYLICFPLINIHSKNLILESRLQWRLSLPPPTPNLGFSPWSLSKSHQFNEFAKSFLSMNPLLCGIIHFFPKRLHRQQLGDKKMQSNQLAVLIHEFCRVKLSENPEMEERGWGGGRGEEKSTKIDCPSRGEWGACLLAQPVRICKDWRRDHLVSWNALTGAAEIP